MLRLKLAKLLKILLVTPFIVLCALGIWKLVLYVIGLEQQRWATALILTCLAASVLIAMIVRMLVQKRREMKFVDGIIGPDERPGNNSALSESSRELRRRFKQAVSTLKKIHHKHPGNPLYVLPWFFMVGRVGSGKSTAIKSARLTSTSSLGDFNRVAGIEGTRNCDWWFLDESVVIDIVGRYSAHHSEERDKKEWRAFLEHVVKYRKKEPINGVIVTVEADRMLAGSLEQCEEEGQTLRKRIDEITSIIGVTFPIYLLVTKLDLIYGTEQYFRLLPDSSVSQAMGLMNHDGVVDISAFVNKTIDTLTEKFKDIRLIMANDDNVVGRYSIEPQVLLFPNEFSRLRGGLIAFCQGAFKDSPFQGLPFLRGIYFCSGCQQGRPVNSLAGSLSKMSSSPEMPSSGDGFFLYDFFTKILPADRSLYSMTSTAKEWSRLTHNLWLIGFVSFVMVFCIHATYSWYENRAIINSVSPEYIKAILLTNDPIDDIGVMANLSNEIKVVEARNRDWKIHRLGLEASVALEQLLKKRYCERFKDHFDIRINRSIESQIAKGGWVQNNYAPAIQIIPFVVRRINMIKGRLNGDDAQALAKRPAPNFAMMIHGDKRPSLDQEIANRYKYAYVNYLVWQNDTQALNKTRIGLQELLKDYFHDNQGDLRWLSDWANQNMPDQAITLNQFWRSDASDSELPSIDPVYTNEGCQLISDFVLNELEKALENPLWIAEPKEKFLVRYSIGFYGAWADFALNFGKAKALFPEQYQWASVIERFSTDDSPYLALLQAMEKQLLEVKDEQWPSLTAYAEKDQHTSRWLAQIRDFSTIRDAMAGDAVSGNKDVDNELSKKLSYMGDSKLSKGIEAYQLYKKALAGFDGISISRIHAYSVAKAGFEDDPGESKSAIFIAERAMNNIRGALTPKDGQMSDIKSDTKNDPFWSLFTEPINELWRYSVLQACNQLQYLWDREVLDKAEVVKDRNQLGAMLFGRQGLVDNYMAQHAGSFVERRSRSGYQSKKVRGCAIPFKPSYFSFMKSGRLWLAAFESATESATESTPESTPESVTESVTDDSAKDHVVEIAGYPTEVNTEARVKPHMTRLVVENTDGDEVLENRQYLIEKKFTWSSDKSGDVTVQIMLGDITLTRSYTGPCAFCKFIRDFPNGRRTFTVKDFPEYRHEIERLGVYIIEVVYKFQHEQVMPILEERNKIDKTPPKERNKIDIPPPKEPKKIDIIPGRPPETIISATID